MKEQEYDFTFDAVTKRTFVFGDCTITYADNGRIRKAWLKVKTGAVVSELAKWQGSDEEGKWIASALVYFVQQLRHRKLSKIHTYCVFCCIGYAMEAANTGRYWHELRHPAEIGNAISVAQSMSGRVFKVPHYGDMVAKAAEQRKLSEARSAL